MPHELKLTKTLDVLLSKIRQARAFNVDEWISKKVTMFNDYMRQCGLKACVISISGGVDSAVVLALCHKAMQEKDSPIKRIVALAQPINSTKHIWERALELDRFEGVEIRTVDQSDIYEQLKAKCDKIVGIEGGQFASGQLRSYMRTPVGYYTAQLLSQEGTPAIVMGTGNLDEDGYLYYFCKAGDGVVDVALIADLHKSEVFEVGAKLNVPDIILKAEPSADLWAGQTDEEELGFTYSFVELYTELIHYPLEEQTQLKNELDEEGKKQFEEWEKLICGVHRRNKHKAVFPVNLNVYNV
eukprot:CAMPEP_0117442982 /NCGR_PEP_ID=MMETSP0759-20121206/4447_1 /TAXON_ID=63605 /ORGANISM="Percolomonas cosmopolitus, Strain WS" /LENGTH=298 /DNA_ID=CAMNT_0005234917 /DNA_START=59 /DNA_END=955 /DNA_ORIENTATION=-